MIGLPAKMLTGAFETASARRTHRRLLPVTPLHQCSERAALQQPRRQLARLVGIAPDQKNRRT